ncbi:5'-nucleotidase C-terminal domain-containing protein [Rubellimicrobium mesophilum]|nr:5'-nucleotidase C-terminal domain-containing protein [Rubellimicrobium mesophilum]
MTNEAEPPTGGTTTARLRILATSDLHSHLLPHDYYADRPRPGMGLAQAARLIRRLRAEWPEGASLLLDNGDSLTGGLLSDLLAARFRLLAPPVRGDSPPRHPMVAAMNVLGYDAATLGNHEFDHGLPFLRSALSEAEFPVVSANILGGDNAPLVRTSVLIERELPGSDGSRHRLRVGIFGVGPPQIADWNATVLGHRVRTRDILKAAGEEIPRLRDAGADLVIALCHSGIGAEDPEPWMENAALPLAALPGLDALIVGHTHRIFPGDGWLRTAALDPEAGTLHGKPALEPGFHGLHVGVLDLDLDRTPTGWRIGGHLARVLPVPPDAPPDEAVAEAAAPAHAFLQAFTGWPVGDTRVPLNSYFDLVAPGAALDVVADAKRREAQRLLRGRPEAELPILCALRSFKTGGRGGPGNYVDIPPGSIALRQAADLYLHPNSLCLLEITGRGLRDWLERSAALFRTLVPGETDQPLLDPAFAPYNFDTIDGLTWDLDLAAPPRTDPEGRPLHPGATRIRNLRHAGRPVGEEDRFVLATNSFRLGRGGGFEAATRARLVLQTHILMPDVVLAYLREGPVHPAPRPRWSFAPLPGTTAWFDSGPGALAHLGEVRGRRIEPLGPTPEGFDRFRLHL